MIELDPFIVNHSLETLRRRNAELRTEFEDYIVTNNKSITDLTTRISEMNASDVETGITITNLQKLIEDMGKVMEVMNTELVLTKLNNIKQEMVTRTLFNLNQYKANDMFVDTFTTDESIDKSLTIRGEWFADSKSIGRTSASTVYVNQPTRKNDILITINAGEDNALAQTFVLDKTQMIDKVSLYIDKHLPSTWKPLVIRISDDLAGTNIIASGSIEPSNITGPGFYDIQLTNAILDKYEEYYITVFTADTYGYRIGVDATGDTYFAGTSYIKYNSVWTDNNFDLAFKVWCFAASDEDNATIITKAVDFTTPVESIVFDVEAVTYSGSVNYYVTIDDGANWKILQPGRETFLNDLPAGRTLRIKAYIEGNSRIDAWGYVIKRGED